VLTLAPPEARMNIAARREPAWDPLTPADGLGVAKIARLEVFDTMAGAEAMSTRFRSCARPGGRSIT
jgi:hypothetical protein